MYREKRYRGSKWEPNWVKCYGGGQADQGEVPDDYCHVTSASGTLCSKSHVIILKILPLKQN